MAIFKYTLPSGSQFTMNAPAGTTQAQADKIFYSQVAAGTFIGYKVGDTLTHPKEALNNFGITRLERGTAGVDDQTLVELISGLPVVTPVPTLNTVPVTNPINYSNYAQVVITPSAGQITQAIQPIGQLSGPEVQSLMAQLASSINQASNVMTQELGVGTYGFNAQQLERAGYIKPGDPEKYCPLNPSTLANPDNFISYMNSPTPWTGLNGVVSVDNILSSPALQNQIQYSLMNQSYNSFVELGMITPPTSPTTTPAASVGYMYNSDGSLTQVSAVTQITTPLGAI